MVETSSPTGTNARWPRSTTLLLLLLGLVMSIGSFAVVLSMPDMAWHPARDAELRATYDAYRDTGTLLIKETGSGSYGVQAPADGPLTFATWDDDSGSYIIASLMSHVTGSDSPYPGLKLAQALLVAIPLLWLPLAVARVVGRARAGFAIVLLPLVVWLFNYGTLLVGTEYGLSDRVSTLPVYSLYGTAASLAFLSLSLIVLLSTYRLRTWALIAATVGIGVLAAFGNLSRSLSGIGIAAAVGVLWWIHARGRWRWLAALGGALVAVVLAVTIQNGVMAAINATRVETTGQSMQEVPDAHTAWHSLYLGLSYPEPITGEPSRFDVTWSDEYGWAKAQEVDPRVLVASEEYDSILRGLYLDEVLSDPIGAAKLYVKKALYLANHFGAITLFILAGFIVGMARRSGLRTRLARVVAIVVPLFILGLVPAVMVMPMLYYYSELSAALGILAAVSLGVIVWALTSWPSRVRMAERSRSVRVSEAASRGVSAVIASTGGSSDASARVASVGSLLNADDEIVLVCGPEAPNADIEWPYACRRVVAISRDGIGAQMRTGLLASTGERVLLVGDALTADEAEVRRALDARGEIVGIVSGQAQARTRVVLLFRRLLLGSAPTLDARILAVDGAWARDFADVSREGGTSWFDELAVASSSQDVPVNAAKTQPGSDAAARPTESGWAAQWRALLGFLRIAIRREEYAAVNGESVRIPVRS